MRSYIICTLAIFVFSQLHARSLIVAPSGAQYNSIGSAVNNMQPGDTVLVRAGKYTFGAYIAKQGQLGAMLTIKNYPGELPEINGW